jgi:hypothetical protein
MLLHAGAGYGTSSNTRLHFYIIPKGTRLENNIEDGEEFACTHFDSGCKFRARGGEDGRKKRKRI